MEDFPHSLCATWHLPIAQNLHEIKFVHLVGVGATVIHVDGKIKSADCLITVISTATIHECILYVNGKRFSEYAKWYSNHFATWKPKITNFTESGTIRNFELDPNMKIPSAIVTSDKEYSNHTLMVDGEMVPLFEEIDEKEHKLEF
ncbi:Protein CBG25825 [Caenorhabditis briggsae]|uniref:Protein CBG25825 n=1 Tax=Caenorhabditis briggsae TaxID=6238 RepID=B6IM32_CAEBR|nr:Protein CBG25825 [Caenorhabditis briggsae]CAS00962.1 Protein CBG25825 [Caenorhabditis briggsae]